MFKVGGIELDIDQYSREEIRRFAAANDKFQEESKGVTIPDMEMEQALRDVIGNDYADQVLVDDNVLTLVRAYKEVANAFSESMQAVKKETEKLSGNREQRRSAERR